MAFSFADPALAYQQSLTDRNQIDLTQLMNPQWARWLDLVNEQAGDRQARFGSQPADPTSNQFRGWSVQPALQGLQRLLKKRTEL